MQMETLPSGTILHGRYRIERALGSGGFGHVYLSVDLQTNAQYALKEYLVTGASGKAQLEHEAQVLSQLHHPNLPAFLSAFDERGHYYVVLGYIEGNDLTDYVRVVRQKNEIIPLARLMDRERALQRQHARELPRQVARQLGAPVVMPSHVGEDLRFATPLAPGAPWATEMLGETQIVERDGTILARLTLEDGEAHVGADVVLDTPDPVDPLSPTFWIPPY